jgi:Flp pilus assembly protein TadD
MVWERLLLVAVLGLGTTLPHVAQGADVRIPLPKRSKVTTVQQLNRDGVEAIRKHQIEKAKSLFYKAYLFDPDDPFTLNNLGYISELEGQVERAQRFYELAAQLATDAEVDRASLSRAEGKTLTEVVRSIGDLPMQVNRANVESVRLLSQGRATEADLLLKQTLASSPGNPFTLNNLGVTKEMEGELEEAAKYYGAAADSHSTEPVIVTMSGQWRGKPISEMATENVRRVQQRLHAHETPEAKAVRLNLRGVSAANRNDWGNARQYFQQAYTSNPDSPFSLNNLGFVFEMNGDLESAQLFYEKARHADAANMRVGFATSRSAEGMRLFQVAEDNDQKVDGKIIQERTVRSRDTGPIVLKRRDGKPIDGPEASPEELSPQEPPTLGPPQPPIPQLTPDLPQPPPPNTEPQDHPQ